jgi:hypothetical protein
MNDYNTEQRQDEMIKTCQKGLFLLIAIFFVWASVWAQVDHAAKRAQSRMDDAAKKAVVDTIAELLEDNYVYPETGEEMGRHIRQRIEAGAYDSFTMPASLASRLQGDLREISHDLHLRVRYDPETAAALLRGGGDDAELHRRRLERERRVNFGFERIERLAGNVGYLDIRFFADTSYARDTAAAAMAVLAGSDAVIFDLRSNGGGSPRMVQFLCSYFFGPEPVHLNSLYWRPSDRTDEFWTLKELPGERYPDTDLYVLTSRRTFSGAEEFTYNMKNLKRATIVGETTGGGAHPVNQKPVNDLFVITIPVGRAINPISKTNWEGVGVEPDVEVSRADALANAHLIALKKIHERTENEDWKRQLQGYIRQIERDLAAKK